MNEATMRMPSVKRVLVRNRVKPGMVPSLLNPEWTAGQTEPTEGLYGEVEFSNGQTYEVSRMAGETDWTVDAAFRGVLPVFSNGYGARCLRTMVLAVPAAVEALNAEAARVGR